MATYTYEMTTEFNVPNITVYKRLRDGVLVGYRINANEGYVFYDSRATNMEPDPETGIERPVTYYYVVAALPVTFNFENCPYIAVPRSTVDENYIFGGTNNNHEVM